MTFYVILVGIVLTYLIVTYNHFIRLRNMVEEAWSSIDVQLKKRYNLIPNLVETVKAYAKHEQETLQAIVNCRNKAISASDLHGQEAAENQLNQSLKGLFALAEAYPDLKANNNFLQLQKDLTVIEGDIEKARRYYNGTVRENNIAIASFPKNLVAKPFGFKKKEFFELENITDRENIALKF